MLYVTILPDKYYLYDVNAKHTVMVTEGKAPIITAFRAKCTILFYCYMLKYRFIEMSCKQF